MKNILLIGLGRFGKHVAYQLNELGHEVMAVDENENLVNEILPYVTDAPVPVLAYRFLTLIHIS